VKPAAQRPEPIRPEPLRLEPIFSPRIWGAHSLAPLFPEKSDLAEPLGEAWLTGLDCKIATSPFRGNTLREAWSEMPVTWRGTRFAAGEEFPLLVKFIFPREMLSLQVHPDDAYAAIHETAAGGRGKTEMWHVVSAEPGAHILLGLKSGVDKQAFLAGLENQTLDSLFKPVGVQAGDTIFVPAGTPHAIGPGMIVCEVQEYSDLTYRVHDFGRTGADGKPRELHIDKALSVTNFGVSVAGKTSPLPLTGRPGNSTLLVACEFFATERWTFTSEVSATVGPERFELVAVLSGNGHVRSQNLSLPYQAGECWLMPASLGHYSLHPEQGDERGTVLIRTYVPDLAKLDAEIRQTGVSEKELAQAVFA
jgi:mannose-6-phosphate isomerase